MQTITSRPSLVVCLASLVVGSACGSPANSDPDASTSTSLPDATTALPDAAPPPPDATPQPDAPPDQNVTVASACNSICNAGSLCGFEDDPACPAECAEALAELGCTNADVEKLAGCAAATTCDELEACILSIPCFDFEGEICGDGLCEGTEDCFSCPSDCGACVCGDGTCSPGECSTCAADCPDGCTCGDVCAVGPPQDPSCGPCQEDVCTLDPFCCQFGWDDLCVEAAANICTAACAP